MDNKHAQIILSVYRPHGQDAKDPFFAEALRQADRDPSVNTWFKHQQRFDADFAATLGSIAAPSDAKAMIKATMGASAGRRRTWWPLALAASVALLLGATLAVQQLRRPSGLPLPENATLEQLATNLAEHHATIGLMSGDMARIQQWLIDRRGPQPDVLPQGLAGMKIFGCETWDTTRGKVSLLCFMGDGAKTVHLYVFENADAFPNLPNSDRPRFEKQGKWSLALWQHNGRAYVLGAPSDSGYSVELLSKS
ncbi:MAG: hypothetical protein HYV95_08900 [Opitutae bacterium]|nr:hypothetical protein [Opitutae bacterium]